MAQGTTHFPVDGVLLLAVFLLASPVFSGCASTAPIPKYSEGMTKEEVQAAVQQRPTAVVVIADLRSKPEEDGFKVLIIATRVNPSHQPRLHSCVLYMVPRTTFASIFGAQGMYLDYVFFDAKDIYVDHYLRFID